jgi:hypothetical protein
MTVSREQNDHPLLPVGVRLLDASAFTAARVSESLGPRDRGDA